MYTIAVLVAFCFTTATAASIDLSDRGQTICENGWTVHHNKCLKVTSFESYFSGAYSLCRDKYGANLLTIGSMEEQRLLEQLFIEVANGNTTTGGYVLLSATRCGHKGSFKWIGTNEEESPLQFEHWFYKEPKNATITEVSCLGFNLIKDNPAYVDYKYGRWSVVSCNVRNRIVCEKPGLQHPISN